MFSDQGGSSAPCRQEEESAHNSSTREPSTSRMKIRCFKDFVFLLLFSSSCVCLLLVFVLERAADKHDVNHHDHKNEQQRASDRDSDDCARAEARATRSNTVCGPYGREIVRRHTRFHQILATDHHGERLRPFFNLMRADRDPNRELRRRINTVCVHLGLAVVIRVVNLLHVVNPRLRARVGERRRALITDALHAQIKIVH
mmetsp:Transcript_10908/g.23301  ORF Transcript_10908/g.23301 Transcript_10908/m.23301 type:complete len:201 (-) Transcript_10908:522-1124(-)